VRQLPRISDEDRAEYDRKHRKRLRAMRSVDEAVAELLQSLRETGQLDNTFIVLWNDNGYHMGQHRIPEGKRTVYEEDVRYPMVIRGPGVRHNAKDERLVSGTDLMPTFLELAGAPIPEYVDGRSLVPLLSGSDPPWRDSLLLEGYDDDFENKDYVPPDFKAIRTSEGRAYVEYETGERELYDLRTDPRQLRSLHDDPERAVEVSALSARLQALKYCSGEACRSAEKPKNTADLPFSEAALLMHGYAPSTRPSVISGETHPTKIYSANLVEGDFSDVRSPHGFVTHLVTL
jgi:N-acetylglucosamine-6-sulfatase